MEKQLKNLIRLLKVMLILLLVVAISSVFGLFKKSETTTTTTTTTTATTAVATTAAAAAPLSVDAVKLALGAAGAAWDGNYASLTQELKTAVTGYFAGAGTPVEFKDDGFYYVTGDTTTAAETTVESATTTAGTTVAGQTTTAAPVNTIPTTKAEILAAYTAVMNKAKTEKPAHQKKEFQSLPKEDQHMDGAIISAILPLANNFMTTEDEVTVEVENKGDDMEWFPVVKSSKGCLLTDVNTIKSAACEKLADGNYKITIILNEEHNPEPYKKGEPTAASNTGKMFYPLSRADIDETLINDSTVNKVVKNLIYDLKYYNCTAVLVYNPKTSQIVTLDQFMSVYVDITDGKVLLFMTATGNAILYTTMKTWDFKY